MSAKIFIIEDESDLVQALVMRLKAEGYQTVYLTDGISALERAREEKPDLILLDICLPGRNGFEVFQQLRQDPARSRDILARIPAGRWGEPSDVGGAAVFLASRASDYVNGHILYVDGGMLACV